MRFGKSVCKFCLTELRGDLYKAIGTCNYCHNNSRRAAQFSQTRNTQLPQVETSLLNPPSLHFSRDSGSELAKASEKSPCIKCFDLNYKSLLKDGVCVSCRFRES